MPIVIFSSDDIAALSEHLSLKGWIQQAYFVKPLNRKCIRVVVRRHFTDGLAEKLCEDITSFYEGYRSYSLIRA